MAHQMRGRSGNVASPTHMRIACAESARSLDRKVKIADHSCLTTISSPGARIESVDRFAIRDARSMSSVVDSVGWNPSSQVSPLWSRLLARSVTRNASAAPSPATGLSN
jgi:hypothetical protein